MKPSNETHLFVGVGGMGMAPLAAWLSESGYPIIGYDDNLQEPVRTYLEAAGVVIRDFIFPEDLAECSTVVHSSAITSGHPLLREAAARGLECLRRGAMLARVAASKRLFAVAGSHGKTTTSGMLSFLLQSRGIRVNRILGGFFQDPSFAPAAVAESDWLIAEIDESDGTIDAFNPEVTLLLNSDWDHADRYPDISALHRAFGGLLARTRGLVLMPEGCAMPAVRPPSADGIRTETFGPPPPDGDPMGWNECAALAAAGCFTGAEETEFPEGFPGMRRRQNLLLERGEVYVVEDYAHHPTEIRTALAALRHRFPGRRVEVVFQPHRFSRTRQFKAEFRDALGEADGLRLLPVYAAHEEPLAGGGTEDLQACFGESGPPILSMDLSGARRLAESVAEGPVVIAFLGAGDVHFFARLFAACLESGFETGAAWTAFLEGQVSSGCRLAQNEPLARKTTLRVGGAARFFAEPANLSDLRALLRAARLFALPLFSLGRGSNLLVSDGGFDGLVIRFNTGLWRETRVLPGGRIWAGAGVRLKEICGKAAGAGLAGFEFLEGIPGAVGGALRMNAGAMGSWMFDVVERVQMVDAAGRFLDLPKDAFHFGYRKVEEISRGIALGAILKSPEAEPETSIRERMDSYSTVRKASQPREPSAGCIFKNPEGGYAGKLIEEAGAKGMRVGDAEVSQVHGNFIINRGQARGRDVLELIRRVRAQVADRSGYILEPEVLLVGEAWDEWLRLPGESQKRGGEHGE